MGGGTRNKSRGGHLERAGNTANVQIHNNFGTILGWDKEWDGTVRDHKASEWTARLAFQISKVGGIKRGKNFSSPSVVRRMDIFDWQSFLGKEWVMGDNFPFLLR